MKINQDLLRGVIEIHVHSAPDICPRSSTDIELATMMRDYKCGAVILKSHHLPTFDRAAIAAEITGFPVYGGVVLNYTVGGFNPHMVELALEMGAKTIWMPTQHAENHMRKENGRSGGLCATENGRVISPLEDILRLIAERDAILQTGHISLGEQLVVIDRAKELGVRKIVVDHPEAHIIAMPPSLQLRLIEDYDVYMCRCSIYFDLARSYPTTLKTLKEIGVKNTVISTDAGNTGLPKWDELMTEQLCYYLQNGITPEAVDEMTRKNPARLLGIGAV